MVKKFIAYCNKAVGKYNNLLHYLTGSSVCPLKQFTKDIGVIRFVIRSAKLGDSHFVVVETNLERRQVEQDYLIVIIDDMYRKDLIYFLNEGIRLCAKKLKSSRVCFIFIEHSVYTKKAKYAIDFLGSYAINFQHESDNKNEKVKLINQLPEYIPICINYPVECLSSDLAKSVAVDESLEESHVFVVTRSLIRNDSQNTNKSFYLERQLVFRCNPMTIQSTVYIDKVLDSGRIMENKFTSEYHCAVLILLAALNCNNWNVVCIGLGGGQLSSAISNMLPIKSIISVEADEVVAKLAVNFFGFKETPSCSVVVGEGMEYIRSMEPKSVDCIIYDVNNNDYEEDLVCPLPSFLDSFVLDDVFRALTPNGLLIVNVVARSNVGLGSALGSIRRKFPCIYSYLMEKEENIVVLAFKNSQQGSVNVNIPKLFSLEKFKPFKNDELTKKVLKYIIKRTYLL